LKLTGFTNDGAITAPVSPAQTRKFRKIDLRMDIRKLQKIVVDALEDIKAKDIEVINVTKLTSLFDRVVIASGDSNRQTRALARHVQEKVKEAGGEIISIEGEQTGEWVLVDAGDVVVHIMQPAVRSYYNLEELWIATPAARRKLMAEHEAEASGSRASRAA
jgi:ribosome-associated protein